MVKEQYQKHKRKKWVFVASMTFLLVFFILFGMTMGSVNIPLKDILMAILGDATPTQETILWRIRLPRVLSAALAGLCLSISGASMQSILRNPLGSPFTLGISNAAAFGAGFAVIVFSGGTMHSTYGDAVIIDNPYIVTITAFGFCAIATFVILFVSRAFESRPQTMILMGIILGSLFSAGSTALQYFADEVQLAAIVYWTFGDLGRADWTEFLIIAIVTIPSAIYFYKNSWNYNTLDAGDDIAQSLGVNIDKTRTWGMMVASLLTATVISFFGIIAYVGLVVPHMIRRILGNDERILIVGSAIFGSVFLLIADTIARTVLSPVILPVGVLTSFLGAPLFLYLLFRRQAKKG
ncbi:MAG: iron chelate uptake ABC transporter family permease subunit [Candidatus Lokiarchaeota archaeon]|nr:iron chelate uptake ABC transporter family permease subunit [Candidatus Lokiarchaeota archaeon]